MGIWVGEWARARAGRWVCLSACLNSTYVSGLARLTSARMCAKMDVTLFARREMTKGEKAANERERVRRAKEAAICPSCGTATATGRCETCVTRKKKNSAKHEYGALPARIAKAIESGEMTCEICGRDAIVIDHEHATGRIRGMLCKSCNGKVGLVEARAGAVIAYIMRYAESNEA